METTTHFKKGPPSCFLDSWFQKINNKSSEDHPPPAPPLDNDDDDIDIKADNVDMKFVEKISDRIFWAKKITHIIRDIC